MSIDIVQLIKKATGLPTVKDTPPKPAPGTKAQVYVMEDGDSYVPLGVNGILASTEKLLALNKGVVD